MVNDLLCVNNLLTKVFKLFYLGYSDKVTWGIKIVKFAGWIGVGISLKNIITKANFAFNYSSIGHGSYMISNNGYSWSHSAP